MHILLTILHIIVAVFLVLVVLLQTGKRADLAGAFGGGGSQTAFGTRGAATLLTKLTTVAAVIFMLTSLSLSIVASRKAGVSGSVLEQVEVPVTPAPSTDSLGLETEGTDLPPLPETTEPEDDLPDPSEP